MDGSQITGTSSSYARKYALNGLLAIDDTKDADTEAHTKQTAKREPKKPEFSEDDLLQAEGWVLTLRNCVANEDAVGVHEVTSQVTNEVKHAIWHLLKNDAASRRKIKELSKAGADLINEWTT